MTLDRDFNVLQRRGIRSRPQTIAAGRRHLDGVLITGPFACEARFAEWQAVAGAAGGTKCLVGNRHGCYAAKGYQGNLGRIRLVGGMGTFSVWHWLLLVGVVIAVVTPIIMASKEKALTRLPYFYRILGVALLFFVLGFLSTLVKDAVSTFLEETGATLDARVVLLGNVVLFVIFIVALVFTTIWSVHRVQDIGWSRWLNLLLGFPYINILYVLVLLFASSAESVGEFRLG